MTASIVPPGDCTTMAEIRAAIDALDREIVALLARRMRYIEAAARVKQHRGAVRDEWRKADVIAKARAAAAANDLSEEHVEAIYELLVERSIAHEFVKFDENGASDGARTRDLRRDRPAL